MPHDTMVHAGNERGQTTELDALVIGAGFAGLYQLLCLRDRLGLSVRALEAGGGLVGLILIGRRITPGSLLQRVTGALLRVVVLEILQQLPTFEVSR